MAQIGLQRVRIDAKLIDAEQRIGIARRRRESGIGCQSFFASLVARGERAERQREFVLPRILPLRGLERGIAVAGLGYAVVDPLACR
jgi:hypothetical protein